MLIAGIPTSLSKRPSSSSGFSSGRSEQSDVSSFNGSSAPLTTLAVFDQPATTTTKKSVVTVVQNGTKERSIRTRAKNSPKLSPKVKRVAEVEENKVNNEQQQVMPAKPFCSAGSGIPKPMAAVKGTAKVVKKPTETAQQVVLERTPGDGKEVAKNKSEMVAASLDSVDLPQVAVAATVKCPTSSQNQPGHEDQLEKPQQNNLVEDQPEDTIAVAKVLPMTSTTDNNKEDSQQDEDEDESMNIQPMTIFPMANKRHDCYESPTTAKRAVNTSYADPLDGYLSEGGASLYARKLHYLAVTQRNKDDDR